MKKHTALNVLYLLLVCLFITQQGDAQNFVTTWETTAASEVITIPTDSGETYLYDVDWENDGTFDDIGVTGDATHTYATAGVQTIAIRGNFPRILFNNAGDKDKIIIINEWGTIAWSSMANAFEGCTNLVVGAIDTPDLSGVTDMSAMFKDATALTTLIGNWDVSTITNMSSLFEGASSFNQNISGWDVSAATNMISLFEGASDFNQDLGGWNVSNVSDMSNMFANAGLSTVNYDNLLNGWASLILQNGVDFNAGTSTYCFGTTARTLITTLFSWNIIDAGQDCSDTFVSTWKTDNPGTSAMNEIMIPTNGPGYLYDVDWGDGTLSTNVMGDATHIYGTAGTYTVKIRGAFPQLFFNNGGDREKLLDVTNWGTIAWSSMEGAFYGCTNLAITATDAPDLSGVTSMRQMFKGAATFNDDISSWDVSTIEDMSETFNEAALFNQDISGWMVDNVENMEAMFAQGSFDQPIGTWNVSQVTTMESMFAETPFNQDIGTWITTSLENTDSMFANATLFNQNISSWNMLNVTNMQGMFLNAESFNQPLNTWIVTNVLTTEGMFSNADNFNQPIDAWVFTSIDNMSGMFTDALAFNQPIGSWQVGTVTNMSNMFNGALAFNQNLNLWDVSQVSDMSFMFAGAISFNSDITGWTVSAATTMENMFNEAIVFNQDISAWDTSMVQNMTEMFTAAAAFDQDIGDWDVTNVTSMDNMFSGVSLSIANYDALLIGWDAQTLQSGLNFNAGTSRYCNGGTARQNMIASDGWQIIDAGAENVNPVPDSATLPSITSECEVTTLPAPTATDACAGVITATTNAFPVSIQGANTITWTYDDGNGNIVTQDQVVTITDNTPPALTAVSNITVAADAGACSAVVNFTPPTVTDNCSFNVVSTHLPNDAFPVGTTTVVYAATDTAGNSAETSFTIVVTDDEDPTFSGCPTSFTVNAEPGSCGAIVNYMEPIAADNCFTSVTSSHNTGQFFAVGVTTVTYTVTDNSGNNSQCSFDITVADTSTPVFVGCPSDIIVNSATGACGATVTYTPPTATDNCGATVTSTNNSGDTFPVGVNTVLYTAIDAAGNSIDCSFTITVLDTTDPVISSCPFDISQNADPGLCTAVVSWTPPLQTDNCSATLTTTHNPGDVFAAGVTTVNYTATDPAGNTDTCSFTVTITENEAPMISNCPTNILIANETGSCGAVATWIPPTQTDNCGASLSSTSVPGDFFPVGATVVEYTATDTSGNQATCSFTVTVADTENPIISGCPSDINVSNDLGECEAIVTWLAPVQSDNCSAILTSTHDSGDAFNVGTTTVVYTATDSSGNSVSCSFNVTVIDNEMPVISNCPTDITVSNDFGQCDANVSWVAPTAQDNCVGLTFVATHASGDMFPVGTTTVTYTATDSAGNSVDCSFTVTVEDDEAPAIACIVDNSVFIDNGTSFTMPDYFGDAIIDITDNCTVPITNVVQNPVPGTQLTPGVYPVTIMATDTAGNVETCSFELTVEEVLATQEFEISEAQVILYPSPATSIVYVEVPKSIEVERITIFDISGRQVKTASFSAAKVSVDVSEMASATYFLHIETNLGNVTKQLIKE